MSKTLKFSSAVFVSRPDRMKILYIADSTSIHTQRWLRYFRNRGNDIYLITIGKKRQRIPNINHIINFERFYYNSISFISILAKTKHLIQQIKPQILHAHFVHQYGWLAAFCNFHPFILTGWGTDILNLPDSSRFKIGKWVTQYALRRADLLTATSEYLKAEMIKLGASPDKVHVIFWGVNSQKFRPDVDTTQIKEELKIGNKRQVILSNRNHTALYNNDIVIEAMCHVLKKFADTTLILQNAGGHLEKGLKRLVHERGIAKSVIFLPQFKHDDLPALYALSDIYVSVPSWDAGPVSLKEAMACNSTPIISAVPGPMEWVEDEVNGRVVAIRNAEELAEAMCDLLRNKHKREKFNKVNRRLIEEKANQVLLMKRMEDLYKSIIC